MKKIVSFTFLLLFGIYTLLLYFSGNLSYYIHPRFFTFTLATSIVSTAAGAIGIITILLKRHELKRFFYSVRNIVIDKKFILIIVLSFLSAFVSTIFIVLLVFIVIIPFKESVFDRIIQKFPMGSSLMIIALLTGFLLPARALSSSTASQRSVDFNSLNVSDNINIAQGFNTDTKNYSIGDWIASFNFNPDLNSYVNKDVSVTGFVYKPDNLPADEILIARFVITCCAVDARPVGLRVKVSSKDSYKEDDWIKVSGKFQLDENLDKKDLIIAPDKIEKTDVPSNPYIY